MATATASASVENALFILTRANNLQTDQSKIYFYSVFWLLVFQKVIFQHSEVKISQYCCKVLIKTRDKL